MNLPWSVGNFIALLTGTPVFFNCLEQCWPYLYQKQKTEDY